MREFGSALSIGDMVPRHAPSDFLSGTRHAARGTRHATSLLHFLLRATATQMERADTAPVGGGPPATRAHGLHEFAPIGSRGTSTRFL